jgi:hypothetical protein
VENDKKVNIGTIERPIIIPEEQVRNPNSTFWNGVAEGDVLVGGKDGINLDKALKIAGQKPSNSSGGNNA